MRALMTPEVRMHRSISPERPVGWPAWLLAAPADSSDPASSTNAFTCSSIPRVGTQNSNNSSGGGLVDVHHSVHGKQCFISTIKKFVWQDECLDVRLGADFDDQP